MKRLILAVCLWALGASFAYSQNQVKICFPTNTAGTNCVPVTSTNGLPITGTISAITSAVATAVAPSYVEGSTNALSMDLAGSIRTLASVSLTLPTIGAAVPATGMYTAINVGGTLTGWTGAVTQGTSPWVVSLTSTTITGSVATTNTALTLAQASTTASQTGPLVQCAVTISAPTYTTAQTDPLSCDTTGSLRVNVTTATGVAQGATTSGLTGSLVMGAVTTAVPSYTTAQTNSLSLTVAGGLRGDISSVAGGIVTATNVAITDAPLNLGVQAVSSENTAVTTARKVQLVADLVGKLIVMPYANPENFVSGVITTAMTGTTTTSLIAAPASGLRNYITQITCSNAHATVGTDIIIQDGSGGTTIYNLPAAAVYGGAALSFPAPLRQPTTATAIFVANVTTGASTKCAASGYKGA